MVCAFETTRVKVVIIIWQPIIKFYGKSLHILRVVYGLNNKSIALGVIINYLFILFIN